MEYLITRESFDPDDCTRKAYGTDDFNKQRIAKVRMQLCASRYNLDVQNVIVELMANPKAGTMSDILSDLIRDGCRYRVEHFPKTATRGMITISNRLRSDSELLPIPSATESGLIPLLSEYHKKKIKGHGIEQAHDSRILTDNEVINIYLSAELARTDILNSRSLRMVVEHRMFNNPAVLKLLKDPIKIRIRGEEVEVE